MKYLLDTNAVFAVLKDATGKVGCRIMAQAEEDIAISAVVLFELYYGAFQSLRREHNLSIYDGLAFQTLTFDREDARIAAEFRSQLKAAGTPIGPYDLLIAAQAVARDLTLITNNTREFSRVPGLRVEDWSV